MENTPPGALGFLQGKTVLSQLVLAVILSIILYISLVALEAVYISYKQIDRTRVAINNLTVESSSSRQYTTNPLDYSKNTYKQIIASDNERTGIEYSYSCFLYITAETFEDNCTSGFRHIFHKGNKNYYPLLGPGVFINTGTNTLRVYQNNTRTWNSYIDVEDIPIKKWFHLVVLVKDNATEVYINGNLSAKLTNPKSVIYQNYQDIYVFSNEKNLNLNTGCPTSTEDKLYILGSMKGMMSRFVYFTYALTYTEIQDLMNEGPNSEIDKEKQDMPPYHMDNWWTGQRYLM